MKLGVIETKKEKNRISFRDFVKKYYQEGQEYIFTITTIFRPNRFPSWSLILSSFDTDVEITKSLSEIQAEEFIKSFKLNKDKPLKGALLFVINSDGSLEIKHDKNVDAVYIPYSWGWRLESID